MKRLIAAAHRCEEGLLTGAFLLAIALPLSEAVGRPLGGWHVPGTAVYVQQLTLWLALLGLFLAAPGVLIAALHIYLALRPPAPEALPAPSAGAQPI